MELKKVQKQGRDERTQEDYPTSVVYFCRCRVVFLRSFISALFLYFFQLHPYLKSSFTESFFPSIIRAEGMAPREGSNDGVRIRGDSCQGSPPCFTHAENFWRTKILSRVNFRVFNFRRWVDRRKYFDAENFQIYGTSDTF